MGFLTAKQFSEKWGISERRIIKLCKEDRINGAIKNGMIWIIPEETMKPSDQRNKIAKYINTQKRIIIANFNNSIGYNLIPLLKKEGYVVDGLYYEKDVDAQKSLDIKYWRINYKNKNEIKKVLKQIDKYYDAMVFIDINGTEELNNKEFVIKSISEKMNCESSIVILNNNKKSPKHIERKLADTIKEKIGARINTIMITENITKNVILNYDELAEDIICVLKDFKNTSGQTILTDGGALKFNKNGDTKGLETGKYYKVITNFFKRMDKDSYMWCASTMMEDEWTEEPLEMNFRVQNLDAANRGAKMDRIFIFSKSKIKEFKKNKTLQIYMQSNINTMFVDYDEIQKKEPELLKIVGDGWDGIDDKFLLVDLPCEKEPRGYISINKEKINTAFECFNRLKKYAKDLKEVLK